MAPVPRRTVLSLVGAGTASLAGCTGIFGRGANERPPAAVGSDWRPPAGTWALPDGGPRRRRAVDTPGATTEPEIVWRRADTTPEYDTVRLVVAATPDTVYVAHESEKRDATTVRAFATADWTERWHHDFPGDPYVTTGGLAGSRLYVERDGRITALGVDGGERWRTDLYDHLSGSVGSAYLPDERSAFDARLVPTAETVYVLSDYGLHGLAATDGTERWRVAFPEYRSLLLGAVVGTDAVWAVVGEVVYRLTTAGFSMLALPEIGFPATAALDDGRILVTAGGQMGGRPAYTMAAYDPDEFTVADDTSPADTAAPAWQFDGHREVDAGSTYVTELAVADGLAVVCEVVAPDGTTAQRATVAAVDTADGSRRWSHEADIAVSGALDGVTPALTAPVVADGTVYVGVAPKWTGSQHPASDSGYLVALDADTGAVRWRHGVGLVPRTLAVAGDCCYVGDGEGGLVVVR